jgi:hypothetical protein
MNNDAVKIALEQKLKSLLTVTNNFFKKAQSKLKILSLYIHSQHLCELKLYDFPLTWVKQKLDSMCVGFIRDWFEAPISPCVSESVTFPKSRGGLGISQFKHLTTVNLDNNNALQTLAKAAWLHRLTSRHCQNLSRQ